MNNSIIDKIFTLVALIFMGVALFFCGKCNNQAKIAETKLAEIETSMTKKLMDTEDKCMRYCDTCIQLMANMTWEKGDERD